MAYFSFFSDYCVDVPLWHEGPEWDDAGLASEEDLGLSDDLCRRLARWCSDDLGDPGEDGDDSPPAPPAVDPLVSRVRGFVLAAEVQRELGDEHEVWVGDPRAPQPPSSPPILVLEGQEADLLRWHAGRLVPVRARDLDMSQEIRRRILHWRREGWHGDRLPGTAAWRAEGLLIAARLQEEAGREAIVFTGGRTEAPPRDPRPAELRGARLEWRAY